MGGSSLAPEVFSKIFSVGGQDLRAEGIGQDRSRRHTVGGRYAALSCFGLVPAALVGVDIHRLLGKAQSMAGLLNESDSTGARLGVVMGILPVVGESIGSPEVYGDDRLFVYLQLDDDQSSDEGLEALASAGRKAMKRRIGATIVLLLILALFSVVLAQSGQFALPWRSIDSGGGEFALQAAVGQAEAVSLSGGPFTMGGGFLVAPISPDEGAIDVFLPLLRG